MSCKRTEKGSETFLVTRRKLFFPPQFHEPSSGQLGFPFMTSLPLVMAGYTAFACVLFYGNQLCFTRAVDGEKVLHFE
jgi:hypothetical protein